MQGRLSLTLPSPSAASHWVAHPEFSQAFRTLHGNADIKGCPHYFRYVFNGTCHATSLALSLPETGR